jgi:ribA/ribD-fused uncharacterized protein
MWPCHVYINGLEYGSVENAYVAQKTDDEEIRLQIQKMKPLESKKFGKTISLVTDWESKKLNVMRHLIKEKFSDKNKELMTKLMETRNTLLEEGNYWKDTFWGVDMHTGKGLNWLGKIIMDRRTELQNNWYGIMS